MLSLWRVMQNMFEISHIFESRWWHSR